MSTTPAGNWRHHIIFQPLPLLHQGRARHHALHQIIETDGVTMVPSLIYMPEMERLLMLMIHKNRPCLVASDDHGATWTEPSPIAEVTSESGMWICYLGNGKVLFCSGPEDFYHLSDDFGETFPHQLPKPTGGDDFPRHTWDPPLVDIDPATGEASRLYLAPYRPGRPYAPYFDFENPCIFISNDQGRSWENERFIPQWRTLNEVAMIRAANGDILAACRTEFLEEHRYRENVQPESDHYSGLVTSVSSDDGQTWTEPKILYRFGRHHPSMAVLPTGEIALIYVVRKGYPIHPSGHDQYGIEAVLSHDHGRTWDLDQPYILNLWQALRKDENAWWASSQGTSTVLLPDGDLLTAYCGGFRNLDSYPPRDIGLVKWRPTLRT
jgi:hypothetical protein